MIELTASDGTKLLFHDASCAYEWITKQQEDLAEIAKAVDKQFPSTKQERYVHFAADLNRLLDTVPEGLNLPGYPTLCVVLGMMAANDMKSLWHTDREMAAKGEVLGAKLEEDEKRQEEVKANMDEFLKEIFTPNGDGEYMRIYNCPLCHEDVRELDKMAHRQEMGICCKNCPDAILTYTGEKRWKEYTPEEKLARDYKAGFFNSGEKGPTGIPTEEGGTYGDP